METERVAIPAHNNDQLDRRKGRPSAAQAANIHGHILDTAWRLFMQRGFDGVTVSDIARQGNLSKRTIYDRFENKDAVFVAVLESRITQWTRDLASPIRGVDFRAWLCTYAERMLRLTMNDQVVAIERLTDGETNRFPHILDIITRGYLNALDILTNGIAAEVARRGLEPRNEAIVARCWFDMLIGHARSSYRMSAPSFDLEAHLEQWVDQLVALFLLMLGGRIEAEADGRGQAADA